MTQIITAAIMGHPIEECLAKVGGDWSKIATAKRNPGEHRIYPTN